MEQHKVTMATVAASQVLALVLVGCADESTVRQSQKPAHSTTSAADRPSQVFEGSRPVGFIFADLPTLMATSEFVLLGSVVSASKGELMARDDILYQRDLVFSVEEQFYGPDLPDTVTVHQAGFSGDVSFELADQRWLYPGDRAFVFVNHDAENSPSMHFDLVAAPGLLKVEAGSRTVHSDATDPLARSLEGRSEADVAQQVRDAVGVVRRGDARPLTVDRGPT